MILYSIALPQRPWMPYGLAAHQLLVRSSTAIPDLTIPWLPWPASAFAAILLKHTGSAGTISAHHLYLTADISKADPLAFCKPTPQTPSDRDALIKAVCSGEPKFFL
jgi:dihydroorotase